MKKTLAILLFFTSMFTACRKYTEPIPQYNLNVSMHANFEEDVIKIYIDDQLLFNGAVSTDPEWSMAKSISTTATRGDHTIKAVVNNNTVATEQFSQNANLHVGIWYNKTEKKLSFDYTGTN